ncbi:MAG: peptidoglycan DD-metalloendopeptidase family protein [Panacibacter sp.]
MTPSFLSTILKKNQHIYRPVVPFNQEQDKLLAMDFTLTNKALNPDILNNTAGFAKYIAQELKNSNARYGIGGYNEHRTIYSRSKYFDSPTGEEPRRLHLGIDIWGSAGTPVFAALGGMVHSFGFNNNYGDYGATIILLHQLDGYAFYTLYGHLSLKDIEHLQEGNYIIIGQEFGHFGMPEENGNWPPHLHFQVITEMGWKRGDYPGVCKYSEREKYLDNCPNPDLILNMMQYAVTESSI